LILIRIGSPALLSGDVVEKPLFVDACSMRPSELIQEWMNNCVQSHDTCQTSFAGELLDERRLTVLPRRLIQTFMSKDGLIQTSPRLIQSDQNFAGSYVTLSHCWGPLDKRPLCTTRANVSQHMVEIPWQCLPQTFQDSISICVDLSIQYLWIDSLCIVQDDEMEWRQESAVMGSIYEQALSLSLPRLQSTLVRASSK
jgi:hypothetical protein